MMMYGAKHHHVSRVVRLDLSEGLNVVILNEGMPTNAVSESCFLSKLTFDCCWNDSSYHSTKLRDGNFIPYIIARPREGLSAVIAVTVVPVATCTAY